MASRPGTSLFGDHDPNDFPEKVYWNAAISFMETKYRLSKKYCSFCTLYFFLLFVFVTSKKFAKTKSDLKV